MLGLWVALSASVLLSLADAGKKVLTRSATNLQILFLTFFCATLLNLVLLYVQGVPVFSWNEVWPYLLLNLLVSLGSEISFVLAIRSADYSVAVPLIGAFPPIFGFVGGMIFFGEQPSWLALCGIALLTLGAYLILLDRTKAGWALAPFKSILHEAGPRYMLLCSLFFILSSLCQKQISSLSSPGFAFAILIAMQTCVVAIVMSVKRQSILDLVRDQPVLTIFTGIVWGAGITLLMLSMSLTLVVYAATISRLGVLIAILIGRFYFHEKHFSQRFSAAAMIVLGAILVMIGGV